MDKLYYTAGELRDVVNLGRTTIWRLQKAGQFPARRQLTDKRVAWLAEEIRAWAEGRPKVAGSEDE